MSLLVTAAAAGGDRLAKICRSLEASGHMKGTSGGASIRVDNDDKVLVTPSGYLKGELKGVEDFFMVSVSSGEVVEHPKNGDVPNKLSDSWEVIRMIYEKVGMDECACVLHSHHEALVLAANIDDMRVTVDDEVRWLWRAPEKQEMLKGIRGYGNDGDPLMVPKISNTPHEKDLCPELARVLDGGKGRPPVVIVENHGVYLWGRTWLEAVRHLECLTWLAQYAVLEAECSPRRKVRRVSASKGDLAGRVLLFDVEGTTTPISFVKETLFPLAERNIGEWTKKHWEDTEGAQVRQLLPKGLSGEGPEGVAEEMRRWIKADRKEAALKTAQGLIWRESYENGSLRAPMFSDVEKCWMDWINRGARIAIFSSGSREAQRLIYKYCRDEEEEEGNDCCDLTRYISCYFDPPSVGGHNKQTPQAYQQIALSMGAHPKDILFFTDIPGEATAAKEVGYGTVIVVRKGNAAIDREKLMKEGHQVVESFEEVKL
ncbi:Methylthioribulose-1-phosphate dehydratase [Perkinsus chesapeaki]|uniref:Methylthioribulose-1-phosphate dehydratase n=1 Tax=Perkinsus chesapeaki TaxID=330153 RepID=A0A7J6N2A9_PERCH|nr:Methylthioribulose-1-phosphate dehydratase [Perkinsus chesapeaki]